MAYTRNDLDALCYQLNKRQSRRDEPSYVPQSRNGYTAVDMFVDGKTHRTLVIGTPRECAFAVMENALDL